MSFGNDFNTRIFRNFVSLMIKYKLYAEFNQKMGTYMNPMVERFLKIEQKKLETPYREFIYFNKIDL